MSESSKYLCASLYIAAITFIAIFPGSVAAATGELSAEQAQISTEDSELSRKSIEIYSEAGIEWRLRYKGGICGVFNPTTRQVEWRDRYKGGVAGVSIL